MKSPEEKATQYERVFNQLYIAARITLNYPEVEKIISKLIDYGEILGKDPMGSDGEKDLGEKTDKMFDDLVK